MSNPFDTTEVRGAQKDAKIALSTYAQSLRHKADRIDSCLESFQDPSEAMAFMQTVIDVTERPPGNANALNEAARWVDAVGYRAGEL